MKVIQVCRLVCSLDFITEPHYLLPEISCCLNALLIFSYFTFILTKSNIPVRRTWDNHSLVKEEEGTDSKYSSGYIQTDTVKDILAWKHDIGLIKETMDEARKAGNTKKVEELNEDLNRYFRGGYKEITEGVA